MVLFVGFAKLVVALQAIAEPRIALKLGALALETAAPAVISRPWLLAAALLGVIAVLVTVRLAPGAPGGTSAPEPPRRSPGRFLP